MDKPHEIDAPKASEDAENARENHAEESADDIEKSIVDSSTPLIDKETAPLAQPEDDEEYIDKPSVISIHDGLEPLYGFDREKDGDVVDLSDRAGTFPYAPGFGPMLNAAGAPSVSPESIPDVNLYQHKKTVAQGMMDLALFSANANQLRYVLESRNHPYYFPGLVLISFSLFFQVAVGVGLLLNTRYNVKDDKEMGHANRVNNFTVVGIFLITVINVFICAFGTTSGTATAA